MSADLNDDGVTYVVDRIGGRQSDVGKEDRIRLESADFVERINRTVSSSVVRP